MTSLTRVPLLILLLLMSAADMSAGVDEQAAQLPGPDPALVILPIPDRVEDILAQLKTRDVQVGQLIDKGNFPAVYVPAFQAKDLVIALEGRLDALPAARRDAAAPAIREVVRLAWLLDAAGDLGNRQTLVAAHGAFSAAVAQVIAAFV